MSKNIPPTTMSVGCMPVKNVMSWRPNHATVAANNVTIVLAAACLKNGTESLLPRIARTRSTIRAASAVSRIIRKSVVYISTIVGAMAALARRGTHLG